MKMVSSTIRIAGRHPADAMSLKPGLHPKRGNRCDKAEARKLAAALADPAGHWEDAVDDDEKRKGRREPRQHRRTVLRLRVDGCATLQAT